MKNHIHTVNNSGGGAVYCLGMLGALIYYISHASSFTNGLLGVFKAFFWPAFFVYKAIEMFHI